MIIGQTIIAIADWVHWVVWLNAFVHFCQICALHD